jgi:hypothetical protein
MSQRRAALPLSVALVGGAGKGARRAADADAETSVPPGLEGTAQALYGTVGVGGASAGLTLVSGALYARLGAHAFWAMAAPCALAVPWTLRPPAGGEGRTP